MQTLVRLSCLWSTKVSVCPDNQVVVVDELVHRSNFARNNYYEGNMEKVCDCAQNREAVNALSHVLNIEKATVECLTRARRSNSAIIAKCHEYSDRNYLNKQIKTLSSSLCCFFLSYLRNCS